MSDLSDIPKEIKKLAEAAGRSRLRRYITTPTEEYIKCLETISESEQRRLTLGEFTDDANSS